MNNISVGKIFKIFKILCIVFGVVFLLVACGDGKDGKSPMADTTASETKAKAQEGGFEDTDAMAYSISSYTKEVTYSTQYKRIWAMAISSCFPLIAFGCDEGLSVYKFLVYHSNCR